MQIYKSVFSLPISGLLIALVKAFLTKLTTGLDDCFVSAPSEDEPVLNINSRNGISIPIEIIEKIIESTVQKK